MFLFFRKGGNSLNNCTVVENVDVPVEKIKKKKKGKKLTKKTMKGKYVPGTRRNKKRPDICDVCRLTMTHKDELIHHLKKIHKVEYRCKTCNKLYKSAKNLTNHEKIHTAPKEFVCEICGYASYNRGTVATHRKRHTKAYTDYCDVCNKGFYTRYQLEEHRNLHTGERPFKCEFCEKGFICKGTLEKHKIANHSKFLENVKNFPCNVCSKTFLFKKNLVRHTRTHTGEKPFVCNYCGKGLASSHSLTVHKRTHTGEKPFVCDLCGKGYGHVKYLKDHIKTHDNKSEKNKRNKQQRIRSSQTILPSPSQQQQQQHHLETIHMNQVTTVLTVTNNQCVNETLNHIPIIGPTVVSMCQQIPRNQHHHNMTIDMNITNDSNLDWTRRTTIDVLEDRTMSGIVTDWTKRTNPSNPIASMGFWQESENR